MGIKAVTIYYTSGAVRESYTSGAVRERADRGQEPIDRRKTTIAGHPHIHTVDLHIRYT